MAFSGGSFQAAEAFVKSFVLDGDSVTFDRTALEGLRVRYRVDGSLRFGETLPLGSSAAINSRVKIMAKLDIAEHRLPQDGRIQIKIAGRDINIRVSTVPILYGESIVIRILDKSRVNYDYEFLGLDAGTLARNIVGKSEGLVRELLERAGEGDFEGRPAILSEGSYQSGVVSQRITYL